MNLRPTLTSPRASGRTRAPSPRSARAFTLTELLVAIAVLVIVIAGTSKIFGTASKVTGISQANQDVLAEAAAIEAQIREDIARLSKEGFFAIHNVAVRNDVRGPAQPLLNSNLAPGAIIRADQLVFFANGVEGTQAYRLTQGGSHKSQGTASRVYYGHGFQLPPPRGLAANNISANTANAHDPDIQAAGPITPWWPAANSPANVNMVRTSFVTGAGTNNFSRTAAGVIDGTQPEARKWLFCRQAVALLDDDTQTNAENGKTVYLGQTLTARSIFIDQPTYGWTRELRNGRVDAAATLLNEIRRWVLFSAATPRQWTGNTPVPVAAGGSQTDVIRSSVYYPRAERAAPSPHRVDQALTNTVISSACSSFIVDWTYEGSDLQRIDINSNVLGGVGEVLDVNGNVAFDAGGNPLTGLVMTSNGEQVWFGFNDPARGVFPYSTLPTTGTGPLRAASTILPLGTFPNNIESQSLAGTFNNPSVQDYWAVFGYNQNRPLDNFGVLDPDLGFTPWPTALRITMVLHDPRGRLEAGREVQFIIDLPKRR